MLTNFVKLKLIRDGKLTLAANLLFGDPEFTIRIGRFKSEATIIDDNVIKAPLLIAVDEAMTFIKKHINLSYHFDGSIQRKERWQYPLEALREFLRSYPELTFSIDEIGDFFKAELHITDLATPQATPQVTRLLQAMEKPLSRRNLQVKLGLRDREHFRREYLQPALKAGLIAMCNPDKPKAADQKYRITEHGKLSIRKEK